MKETLQSRFLPSVTHLLKNGTTDPFTYKIFLISTPPRCEMQSAISHQTPSFRPLLPLSRAKKRPFPAHTELPYPSSAPATALS